MNKNLYLVPYWFLNFTIGFGWFTLSPLVPALISQYEVSLPSIIELISLYGYTMVAFALVSGYLAAKYSVSASLLMSGVLSVAGLFIRALSTDYSVLLVGQVIAAIAYPLALGPVGTLAQSINQKKSHMIIGVSVGILFLGMSSGSFLGPYVFSALGTVKNVFLLDTVLALISLAMLPLAVKKYPREYAGRSLKGSFSPGMLKNWYVGLIISSFSVMFGVIASSELINKGISSSNALHYGGLFGGLAFLGSALGAILLPWLFEDMKKVREGMILTSVTAFVSLAVLAYYLSFTSLIEILSVSYFLLLSVQSGRFLR
ncbi:MAG: MFS transporter [Candidatus Thermoplasmatota archaeon]|nr:MFS transporter [Candidatus Thermoplasmatota archaeon]